MDKDKLIIELKQMTLNIMKRLYEAEFEELESFVEVRQKLVDDIIRQFLSDPATESEKVEIIKILDNDPEITARMNALRLEAQDWLQKRNQAKAQRSAYEAAYTPDSFLMDRRK